MYELLRSASLHPVPTVPGDRQYDQESSKRYAARPQRSALARSGHARALARLGLAARRAQLPQDPELPSHSEAGGRPMKFKVTAARLHCAPASRDLWALAAAARKRSFKKGESRLK